MNHIRERRKRLECISHRVAQFDKALDGLIAGTHSPEYVNKRWQLLKRLIK